MIREPIQKDGDYAVMTLIMESSKEAQEWDRAIPPTSDLPATHEHFVENVRDESRGGILTKRIGVRLKANPPAEVSDGLDKLDVKSLEVQAASAGLNVEEWRKLSNKPAKVQAIREARANLQPA